MSEWVREQTITKWGELAALAHPDPKTTLIQHAPVAQKPSLSFVADALIGAAVAQPDISARVVGGKGMRPDGAIAHPTERRVEHAMHEEDNLCGTPSG